MDKMALLSEIQAMRKAMNDALDRMTERVMASEDAPPAEVTAPQAEGLFTARMVMRYLRIPKTTFYDWIRQGRLPPGKPWGKHSKRWKQSDLDAWMVSERQKEGANGSKRGAHRGSRRVSTAAQGL